MTDLKGESPKSGRAGFFSYVTHPLTVLWSLRETVPIAWRENKEMRSFSAQLKSESPREVKQLNRWNLLKGGIDSAKPILIRSFGGLPIWGAFIGFVSVIATRSAFSNHVDYVINSTKAKIAIETEAGLANNYLNSDSTDTEKHKRQSPKVADAKADFLEATSNSRVSLTKLVISSVFLGLMSPVAVGLMGVSAIYSGAVNLYDLHRLKEKQKEKVSAVNDFQKSTNNLLDADQIIRDTNAGKLIAPQIDGEAQSAFERADAYFKEKKGLKNKEIPFISLSSSIAWLSAAIVGLSADSGGAGFIFGAAALMASDNIANGVKEYLKNHSERVDAYRDYSENIKGLEYSVTKVRTGEKELQSSRGHLRIQDVDFAYSDTGRGVRGIDLSFGPGKVNVLTGESGSGKSTVFDLLRHRLEASSGSVTIDCVDMSELSRESINNQITYIAQKPQFLKKTIADEILLFNPKANPEEMTECLKKAGLDLSPDTRVYDDAGTPTLSGGQLQRVAIARALARKSPVLLMDEPTTGLDNQTKTAFWDTIKSLSAERTIVIVSHDTHEVLNADRTIVLENGKITADGNPRKLIEEGNSYLTQMYKKVQKTAQNPSSLAETLNYLSSIQFSIPAPKIEDMGNAVLSTIAVRKQNS